MAIRALSAEVISRIAAGEVVERPASVVKELVENSLDADATRVTIEVRGGGISFIRITDNGTGIPSGEVELVFQRHATSKISSLSDLERITSLGFRGEALPSIAAVAEVELLTRTSEEVAGTYLSLRNGVLADKGTRGCPLGTIVTVRHLFRQIPARLKFLKSSSTESNHITHLLSQFCLAFPEVRFTLILDGRLVLRTSGNGNLRDALVSVYGLEIAQAMWEVKKGIATSPFITISGYISPPSLSRSSRNYLSFFVNRRWIHSRLLFRAVEEAYQGQLAERFPIAVLHLLLPTGDLDVNVHPTKSEIRFRQEQAVFAYVRQAVQQTLQEAPLPQIKPPPISATSLESYKPQDISSSSAAEKLALFPSATARVSLPLLRVLGQVANAYIICEGPDGLYLLDQHAAHERVLFEKILAQRGGQGIEVQGLLEPVTMELTPRQEERLNQGKDILARFGFSLEPFGGRTYLVRALPSLLAKDKVAETIKELLDSSEEEVTSAKWEEKIALSLACHSAVRAGQSLTPEEMRGLVQQLEQATSPRTCPHGRPTTIYLSSGQLEREFGRT